MAKEYIYNNFIWKGIYGNINTNRIFPQFKKGVQFEKGFNSVTSDCVSLANYSIKNSETILYLSIKDNGVFFEYNSNWIATKMKGAFLETIFDEIVNQNKIENEYANWRGNLFDFLLSLKDKVTDLKLVKSTDFKIELSFKAHLNQLQEKFEPEQLLDLKFIINLANKRPSDIYKIGLDFLNVDDKKCIGILKTIVETHPYAGIVIGIAYYNLGNSELSNEYITSALNAVDYLDFTDDFTGLLAEIIATNEFNLGVTNDRTIRMFFEVLNLNQSSTALIKLSYIVLSNNIKHLKEFALENVSLAITYNLSDDNEFTKIAGFHIICSVLLWNDKFNEAENYHSCFLKVNNSFLNNYNNLVEGYVTLALAKNDINFISNLILDFPHLRDVYSGLFDAWSVQNEESKYWSNLDRYNYQKIMKAKKLYCD